MADKKTTKRRVTVAKAKKDEFKRVWGFVHAMEALFDGRGCFSSEEDWREWPDDDRQKRMLLRIERELIDEGEATWDGHPDNDLILYRFIKRIWREANYSGSFGRILFNCETLIDNCCDPKLDYLEFKPSIMHAERDALEKVEKVIARAGKKGLTAEETLAMVTERIAAWKGEQA